MVKAPQTGDFLSVRLFACHVAIAPVLVLSALLIAHHVVPTHSAPGNACTQPTHTRPYTVNHCLPISHSLPVGLPYLNPRLLSHSTLTPLHPSCRKAVHSKHGKPQKSAPIPYLRISHAPRPYPHPISSSSPQSTTSHLLNPTHLPRDTTSPPCPSSAFAHSL
eukprot:3388594-Rhodomonas_salina.1